MPEIAVMVTKSVRIDRDGARSLLRVYSDWLNNQILDEERVLQANVEQFLKRYANLEPGEETDG